MRTGRKDPRSWRHLWRRMADPMETSAYKRLKKGAFFPGERGYDTGKTLRTAITQSLPVIFSYLVISFAFGVSLNVAGYGALTAFLMSVFIYSGTLQLALVPMLTAGTPIPVIAISAFLMTSRHMFYGIGYTERFNSYGPFRPYMIFTLTDEMYGILSSSDYPADADPAWADILSSVMSRWSWILGSVIGAAAGSMLPFDLSGMDFAITCLFACSLIGQWKDTGIHANVAMAAIIGIGCLLIFGPDGFMLPALSLTLILLIVFKRKVEKLDAERIL